MIDCYPDTPLRGAEFDGSPGIMPWNVANLFDRSGYRLIRSSSAMLMSGGPRDRLMGRPKIHEELMKYPLVFVEDLTCFSVSIHKPWPFYRNFSPILGVLLHFKFSSVTEQSIEVAISDNQYYKDGRSYKDLLEVIRSNGLSKLKCDKYSIPFEDSWQLSALGFYKTMF
jgi:hypothetical protein